MTWTLKYEELPGVHVDNSSQRASGDPEEVFDPSTGVVIAVISAATDPDVDRAARSATEATEAWAAAPPSVRVAHLLRCAAAIRAGADELIEADVRNAGLPRSVAERDVEVAARYFEYYAGLADKLHGETIPLGSEFVDYTIREPWGVCGIVLPFNFPLQLAARDIAPALAVGNTVVAKPADQTPLPVIALVERCWEGGLPAGVLNVVVGPGSVGDALVRHPLVDHVTFTGSEQTGRRVMATCAELIKPLTIELGGKSPHLLFEDGSIEAAVASIVATTFRSAGQACSAGTRLLVHRTVHNAAVEALADAVRMLTVGPADSDPDVGPVISARQRDAVLEAISDAIRDGVVAAVGGGRPSAPRLRDGFFVEPTVLVDVAPTHAVARKEIFGPCIAVLTFSDDEEAIRLANDTDYGLIAGVWTHDLSRAHRVARTLKAGQVFINTYGVGGGVELPFGGYKRSGIGRLKGTAGALEYTQLKNVCVALA